MSDTPLGSETTASLTSQGASIAVDWFGASTPGPAVLMLHGADGLRFVDRYRAGARVLASGGVSVALVHYLDASGETRVGFSSLGRNFGRWVATVRDSLDWLAKRPGVDPARLGLVGISLGATLSLTVASDDERVRAIVDYFGPLPGTLANATHLPPTLILHGADDPIVGVDHARNLSALLKERGVRYERVIYPGQGHGFHGAASEDADRRALTFLAKHL